MEQGGEGGKCDRWQDILELAEIAKDNAVNVKDGEVVSEFRDNYHCSILTQSRSVEGKSTHMQNRGHKAASSVHMAEGKPRFRMTTSLCCKILQRHRRFSLKFLRAEQVLHLVSVKKH